MKIWTTINKTKWVRGEWDKEPDKAQWIDEASNLDCLIVRNRHAGNLCGYVGVTEGHPLFEMGYSEVYEINNDINVHGGLTFAGFCHETDDPGKGICHVAEPGRQENVWWLGFDCAHAWDYSCMGYSENSDRRCGWDQQYRSFTYVKRECEALAAQLKEMQK